MPSVLDRAQTRFPSFWLLQTIGCCCFGLTSVLLVMPYVRQPWELGYPNLEGLFSDQMVMCLGVFIATPDPIEGLEACIKASALLFLWCNLYFSVKHSQRQSQVEVAHQPML